MDARKERGKAVAGDRVFNSPQLFAPFGSGDLTSRNRTEQPSRWNGGTARVVRRERRPIPFGGTAGPGAELQPDISMAVCASGVTSTKEAEKFEEERGAAAKAARRNAVKAKGELEAPITELVAAGSGTRVTRKCQGICGARRAQRQKPEAETEKGAVSG